MLNPPKTFADMLSGCHRTAVHLEMRDTYTPDDLQFLRWKEEGVIDPEETRWVQWTNLVRSALERGVCVQRARIVSEPVTDFIRHEHALADAVNIPAGEQLRWLPRRQASDLALPGNDFWVFDDHLVRFGFFSGEGHYLGEELTDDPAVIKLCLTAFESVWERATAHSEYRLS